MTSGVPLSPMERRRILRMYNSGTKVGTIARMLGHQRKTVLRALYLAGVDEVCLGNTFQRKEPPCQP